MFFRPKRIAQLPKREIELSKLKQGMSIVVIDDDPNAFPELSMLTAEGYRITRWAKIESMAQLESGTFDIIVLDISGVARDWGEHDGLEVLRLLKENNPAQYVIAFSGQRAVHQLEEFWKLADDSLKKPVTAADFKRKLDTALYANANIENLWTRIRDRLSASGVPASQIEKLEREIVRQIKNNDSDVSKIRQMLMNVMGNEKVQQVLVALAGRLIVKAITQI